MSPLSWGFNSTRIRPPRSQGARAIDALAAVHSGAAPSTVRYAHFLVAGDVRWTVDARAVLVAWAARCAADVVDLSDGRAALYADRARQDAARIHTRATEGCYADLAPAALLAAHNAIRAHVEVGAAQWPLFDLYSLWLEVALEAAAVGLSVADHAAFLGDTERTTFP